MYSMGRPRVEGLLHPVRFRIVQALVKRTLTAQQLATLIPEVSQVTIYRHLQILVEADIVQVVAEQRVRGAVERSYGISNPQSTNLSKTDVQTLDRDDLRKIFNGLIGGLLADFERYLDQPNIDLVSDGATYIQEIVYLSDEEMQEFLAQWRAQLEALNRNVPAPGRRRRSLSYVFLPDPSDIPLVTDQTTDPPSQEDEP